MEYITKQESFNSGGGCYVDALTLSNNQVLIINDEAIGLYDSIDDFFNDDGTKCLFSLYLKSKLQGALNEWYFLHCDSNNHFNNLWFMGYF